MGDRRRPTIFWPHHLRLTETQAVFDGVNSLTIARVRQGCIQVSRLGRALDGGHVFSYRPTSAILSTGVHST